MSYFFYRLTRFVLFPVLNYILPLFSQKLRERIQFEYSDKVESKNIDFTFEVSSEGELEQVKVPLLDLIAANKTVELLYCSPSVDRKCKELASEHENLVTRPLPLITFFPFGARYRKQIPQGNTLVMCRYDFFPELIHFSLKHPSILMSASAQNFSSKNILIKKYLKASYRSFNYIITATENDLDLFKKYGVSSPMRQFDFRALSILERQNHAKDTISKKSNFLIPKLIPYLQKRNPVIFGSFWTHEIELISKELIKTYKPLLAPHKLDDNSLKELSHVAEKKDIKLYFIGSETTEAELDELMAQDALEPGVWVSIFKGILCEFYTYFDHIYVGGGFGVSVHSVLEPFMTGAHVYFGPINHRSSEKVSILNKDKSRVHILNDMNEFISVLNDSTKKTTQRVAGQEIELALEYKSIISWLNW